MRRTTCSCPSQGIVPDRGSHLFREGVGAASALPRRRLRAAACRRSSSRSTAPRTWTPSTSTEAAVENTLTNAFRNGVADRVSAACRDLYPVAPRGALRRDRRHPLPDAVDPFVRHARPPAAGLLGPQPVDHLIRLLPQALADDGVAYVLQTLAALPGAHGRARAPPRAAGARRRLRLPLPSPTTSATAPSRSRSSSGCPTRTTSTVCGDDVSSATSWRSFTGVDTSARARRVACAAAAPTRSREDRYARRSACSAHEGACRLGPRRPGARGRDAVGGRVTGHRGAVRRASSSTRSTAVEATPARRTPTTSSSCATAAPRR